MKNMGMMEKQLPELQRYSMDELIAFIFDKLKNHKEITLSCVQLHLLQMILFEQMHRITQS